MSAEEQGLVISWTYDMVRFLEISSRKPISVEDTLKAACELADLATSFELEEPRRFLTCAASILRVATSVDQSIAHNKPRLYWLCDAINNLVCRTRRRNHGRNCWNEIVTLLFALKSMPHHDDSSVLLIDSIAELVFEVSSFQDSTTPRTNALIFEALDYELQQDSKSMDEDAAAAIAKLVEAFAFVSEKMATVRRPLWPLCTVA